MSDGRLRPGDKLLEVRLPTRTYFLCSWQFVVFEKMQHNMQDMQDNMVHEVDVADP